MLRDKIDMAILNPHLSDEELKFILTEADKCGFASICVLPTYVKIAKETLIDTSVCVVIGFPLGSNERIVKSMETRTAITNGADEIDVVANHNYIRNARYDLLESELRYIISSSGNKPIKVIIECSKLQKTEIRETILLLDRLRIKFVKTGSGFFGPANIEDIEFMNNVIRGYGLGLLIKASGGIKTLEDCERFIEAGASRIGTSSGMAITQEEIDAGDV